MFSFNSCPDILFNQTTNVYSMVVLEEGIHPLVTVNVQNLNPSNSCNISVWTNVEDRLADILTHRQTNISIPKEALLAWLKIFMLFYAVLHESIYSSTSYKYNSASIHSVLQGTISHMHIGFHHVGIKLVLTTALRQHTYTAHCYCTWYCC